MNGHVPAIAHRVKEYPLEKYGSGSKSLILYGSYTRGTATENSDLDLLVVVGNSLDPWQVRRSLDDLLIDILL